MQTITNKYAQLIVNYCVEVSKGDKVFIRSTTLAEPFVREIYREALKAGASMVEIDFEFEGKSNIFAQHGSLEAMKEVSPTFATAVSEFDCYIYVRAPFNLFENDPQTDKNKTQIRSKALAPYNEIYFDRTGTRELRRTLCQYPTQAAAQNARMSLEKYSEFIYNACKLNLENPTKGWLTVRAEQQRVVDYLNQCTHFRYLANHTDISFTTNGRTWMNSDGQTNMPSGEVYTSPEEDSVNGHIHFTLTGVYGGNEVEGVTLNVKDGFIESWTANSGIDFLNQIFKIEGTRVFGEAAIGTNYGINQITKNILFDEKMGGTVHMAIGQSYKQCGGKNTSSVHWDMITDMTTDGQIFADDQLIYEKGKFLI